MASRPAQQAEAILVSMLWQASLCINKECALWVTQSWRPCRVLPERVRMARLPAPAGEACPTVLTTFAPLSCSGAPSQHAYRCRRGYPQRQS